MSVQQPNDDSAERVVYEKKYFDYLPNDLDSEDVTDEDATHELVNSSVDILATEHEASKENVRRVNSRKFKRDLTSQSRPKRQHFYYVPVPLVHYSPHPNFDFYFPQDMQPAASTAFQSRFGEDSFIRNPRPNPNPWHPQNNPGKLHPPYNTYLPAMDKLVESFHY